MEVLKFAILVLAITLQPNTCETTSLPEVLSEQTNEHDDDTKTVDTAPVEQTDSTNDRRRHEHHHAKVETSTIGARNEQDLHNGETPPTDMDTFEEPQEWTETDNDILNATETFYSTDSVTTVSSPSPTPVSPQAPETNHAQGCPKCIDKNKEKETRVEMVKEHILHKLGLKSVPNVGGPLPPLPFDFYMDENLAVNDEDEDAPEVEEEISHTVTKEIFVFGKDITEKCYQKKSTGCYSFNISQKFIDPDLVSSIELWVYKQSDKNDYHPQTFMVSELEPMVKGGKKMLRFRNIVKRMETRLKSGWMKIYVKRSVLRWLTKPHKNHGLAVVCKTCHRQSHKAVYGDKEGLGPILVFYMNDRKPRSRGRRSTQCNEGGNNCCHRESLTINFRDIGWDYIMAPSRIRPNFCTGSCNGILAAHYNHTRVMQTLHNSVTNLYGPIQTCCSPVSFGRPQSLLYRDDMDVVRKVDVPDLIVGECGCT